jgi:predicted lipoprotein with Yx(FWY)xxD motif
LYLFAPDKQGMVTCSGACAAAWPPLTTTTPVAGSGVQSSLLGTVKAPDGSTVVTYNQWPLYTFANDSGPGQATGQGVNAFGGLWSAVTGAGHAAQGSPSSASSTPSGGSSGGYGY